MSRTKVETGGVAKVKCGRGKADVKMKSVGESRMKVKVNSGLGKRAVEMEDR